MRSLLNLTLSFLALFASAATIRAGGAPIISTNIIGPVRLVVGQTLEFSSPNLFDTDYQKLLTFSGTATPDVFTGQTPQLIVQFDWLGLTGNEVFSDPFPVLVPINDTLFNITFTIPFCPTTVSLHMNVLNSPITVTGLFIHECLVPEADTLVPAGVCFLGLMGWSWRRRRQARSV